MFTTNAQITGVSPTSATIPEELTVEISGSGTHFAQATITTVWFSQGSNTIYSANNSAINDELLEADFVFGPSVDTGYYDVVTYNEIDGTLVLDDGFYLHPNPFTPEIVSVDPDEGELGESLTVAISGQYTHFSQGTGTTIWFSQGEETIYPESVTILDDEQLNADFYIDPDVNPGEYDVNTSNYFDGQITLMNGFTVLTAFPKVVGFDPGTGYQGDELVINITGQNTHFLSGENPVVWFNLGTINVYADSYTATNEENLVVTFQFPFTIPVGGWYLNVKNDSDGLLTADELFILELNPDQPAIGYILPDSGQVDQTHLISLVTQNTHFEKEGLETTLWFTREDETIFPTSTTVISNTELQSEISIPQDAETGLWNVYVENEFDGQLILEDGFNIKDSTNSISQVSVIREIKLFPNPNNGEFYLTVNLFEETELSVFIIDILGNTNELLNFGIGNLYEEKISLSHLPDAVYFIKIVAGNQVSIRKLVVSN